jgi:hypothetical protein
VVGSCWIPSCVTGAFWTVNAQVLRTCRFLTRSQIAVRILLGCVQLGDAEQPSDFAIYNAAIKALQSIILNQKKA